MVEHRNGASSSSTSVDDSPKGYERNIPTSNTMHRSDSAISNGSYAKRRAVVAGKKFGQSLSGHVRSVGSAFTPAKIKLFLRKEWGYILFGILAVIGTAFLNAYAWPELTSEAWFVIWITMVGIVCMVRNFVDPDVILFACVTVFLLAGTIDAKDAFGGLSNESILTIALTVALAVGIENTGALDYMPKLMYGGSCAIAKWRVVGQARMFTIVASISAFINNTPLVAVFIPVMQKYCADNKQAPSQFMMPLSTAAILGGLCTIIGTSTNLIVQGFVHDDYPDVRLGFFEIGYVGVPMAIAGLIYVCAFSKLLLPTRGGATSDMCKNARNYSVQVIVNKNFVGVNETVEVAGLRGLRKLFLTQIQRRNGTVVPAPGPEDLVLEGDVLVFSGDMDSVTQLLDQSGLKVVGTYDYTEALKSRPENDIESHMARSGARQLVEAVVGVASPIVGKTIKEAHFRTKYHASVIAMYRQGETVKNAADVPLHGGDTLLLEATDEFVSEYRLSRDFALVTYPYEVPKTRRDPVKMLLALGLFLTMIVLNACDVKGLATLALAVLYLFFILRIMTINEFRNSIPGMILLTIAGGFGVSKALEKTGVAKVIGDTIINGFDWMGSIGPVFGLYLATEILTALLSNGAAVTIMYPIAKSIVDYVGGDGKSYWYALMLAASSDFMTPVGYQTNLMVMGVGGYNFMDYVRYGFGLQVITIAIATVLCHYIF